MGAMTADNLSENLKIKSGKQMALLSARVNMNLLESTKGLQSEDHCLLLQCLTLLGPWEKTKGLLII